MNKSIAVIVLATSVCEQAEQGNVSGEPVLVAESLRTLADRVLTPAGETVLADRCRAAADKVAC